MEIEQAFKFKGFDQLDLIQVTSESKSFVAEANNIKHVTKSSTYGIGVRTIVNNKVGYSYANSTDELEKAVKSAIELSKLSDTNLKLQAYSKYPSPKKLFDKKIVNADDSAIIDAMKQTIDIAQKNNNELTSSEVDLIISKIRYLNSEGVDISKKATHQHYDISTNYQNSSGVAIDTSRIFFLEFTKYAQDACNMAKLNSIKKDIPSGKFPVVFHPRAFKQLIEFGLMPSFCADNFQHNKSLFNNKMGERLFDKKLTMCDNGILNAGIKSSSFDSEGVPSQKNTLIGNGIIKNLAYDLSSAQKENKRSTGNGFRGYNSRVAIGNSNIVIKPKKKDVLSQVDKGLHVVCALNAHSINPISGDFSVGCALGFWVEHGEQKFAPKQVMVSGNILDLLKKIEIGNNPEQVSFGHSRGAYVGPSILAECNVIGS